MLTSFSFSLSIIYSISQSKHVLSIFWVSMCENLDAHIFPFRQSSIFSNMMVFLHLSLIWNLPLVLSLTMSLCSFCIPCTSGGGFDNFYSLCSSFKISSSLFIIVSMGKLLNLVFYRVLPLFDLMCEVFIFRRNLWPVSFGRFNRDPHFFDWSLTRHYDFLHLCYLDESYNSHTFPLDHTVCWLYKWC